MTRVLIADDHAIFREGLRQILEDIEDLQVVDEASHGQEVLDIAMPGLSGLETMKLIKGRKPKMKVLILSMYPEEQYAVRAIKAGASGYITKSSASEELLGAIRKVMSGGKYITSSVADKLLADLGPDSGHPLHELLSDREYQVLCLIASGKTVSEIADQLALSVKTVSTHRVHILEKMKMKTNAELTNYAIKQNLVSLTD
jgi:DNA-binding NarL/FixJ family response regulator